MSWLRVDAASTPCLAARLDEFQPSAFRAMPDQ
jgi:hypothetical protein